MLHIIVSIKATAKTREKKTLLIARRGGKIKSLSVLYTHRPEIDQGSLEAFDLSTSHSSRALCVPTDRPKREALLSLSLSLSLSLFLLLSIYAIWEEERKREEGFL